MGEDVHGRGHGPVAAHRHLNPNGELGGWVQDTSKDISSGILPGHEFLQALTGGVR